MILTLLLTSVLIGTNWLLYVYAINNGHILAGSLGYYLNPAGQHPARPLPARRATRRAGNGWRWGLPGPGLRCSPPGPPGTLWISLTLCFSFATYGLLRKVIAVDSLAGLSIETALLFPLALGWLLLGGAAGRPMFDHPGAINAYLIAAGHRLDRRPCCCFTAAARRLPYSTVGMLQFLAPTLQFLLAVGLYGEHFSTAHADRLRRDLDRARALRVVAAERTAGEPRRATRPNWAKPECRARKLHAQYRLDHHRYRRLAVRRLAFLPLLALGSIG